MKVFVILFCPCSVFLQKLILPGFILLFEGYHENLRKISERVVPLTPLGMVWSPSYGSPFQNDRSCEMKGVGTSPVSNYLPAFVSNRSETEGGDTPVGQVAGTPKSRLRVSR